jgi:glucose/arabinose dehydrogenase
MTARASDALPQVPSGFVVEPIATGVQGPRVLRVAPNGDVFVAASDAGKILVYRLTAGSATPAQSGVFASGLNEPYGMAFYPAGANPQWLYIANTDGVVRMPYHSGDLKASAAAQTLVEHLPTGHHWTRDIVFAPDGQHFYVSVGSGSNVAQQIGATPRGQGGLGAWVRDQPLGATWGDEARRADILVFDPLGHNERIFATGLRNPSGLTIDPATGGLWTVVNERDELGDNLPFDYATHVTEGAFYGWPWYYIGGHEDPRHLGERPDLQARVTLPDVLFQAHSAPLQIVFYQGDNFPAEYRGDAFVALHGSWNRARRTGYKIVRLLFDKNGKPTGAYEDFMTGFVAGDNAVWGRPVGVAIAQDGALLVCEDGNGTIWRVAHRN